MSDTVDSSGSDQGVGDPHARFIPESGSGVSRGGSSSRSSRATTRIYLVRHGRTPLNAAGVLRGRLDPGLDAVGIFQAKMLGDVIGRMELQLIVSSPLKRAVETATAVAMRAGLDVEIDPRLIDRDYGSWAGKTREALIAQWGSVDAAPGVEPESEVFARALDAVMDTCRRAPGGAVVMVSHDVVNRMLLSAFDARLEGMGTVPQDTGCFNVIEHRGEDWSVLSVNNTPGGHDPPEEYAVQSEDDSRVSSDASSEGSQNG